MTGPVIRWPPWCRGLPASVLAELGAAAVRRRYPAGTVLFMEGDPGHQALILQRGAVKLVATAREGREIVLDVLGPGSVLGELAALDRGPRSATAVALTTVELEAIPGDTFREVGHRHPELFEQLLIEVAARLRASDRKQLEFGGDALGRVCARLLEVAARQGSETELDLPVSQADLASWTGLSREAVVKALAALRRLGWIRTSGRRVVLVHPDEVRSRATG